MLMYQGFLGSIAALFDTQRIIKNEDKLNELINMLKNTITNDLYHSLFKNAMQSNDIIIIFYLGVRRFLFIKQR